MTKTLSTQLSGLTRLSLAIILSTLAGLFALTACLSPGSLQAQNLFAPVAKVNDRVITAYELSQRMAFLRLLRAPGDVREMATKQLVEERLQLSAAENLGVAIDEEKLQEGMSEFAGRANMETAQFITAIAQGGVAGESFRDFVKAGMIWREVVRAKFIGRVNITEAEIDRAAAGAGSGARQISLEYARYFIPGGQSSAALSEARKIQQDVDTCDDLYTIAKGQPEDVLARDTLPVGEIPADIAGELARLDEGEVSTALTRNNGETLVFLMLCGRTSVLAEEISREDIRNQLSSRRLAVLANSYLEDLRADAFIEIY
ncbi:MAG: hypothetical protein GY945_10450 [Rhodobacteraceae bacterium]|nr:hypothetical protein [Paracoccaceae bacterium]